jgi:hypothetical protein
MSEPQDVDSSRRDGADAAARDLPYEAPRLVPLGNARDLLAAAFGTHLDAAPPLKQSG